jgi:RNA polymerase sigma-70 factor (ECF subfamily)
MSDLTEDGAQTDAALLDNVRNPRNHPAWETFIARYRPMIRGWCRQWFPYEADDKACDVLSDLVFIMMRFEYDPEKGRFRAWLKTVTHNMMAKLTKGLPPQFDTLNDPAEMAEAGEDMAARLAREFDLELLDVAKKRVQQRVKRHTWLAYVATAEEGRKAPEVARELGLKIGSVFQAKRSVIELLKQEIKKLQPTA